MIGHRVQGYQCRQGDALLLELRADSASSREEQRLVFKRKRYEMSNYFDKIIDDAKAELATWSKEKRESVQLEGFVPDYNREPTCRHCGCTLPCPC